MPATNIKTILDTKPLAFTLRTGGGKWKCTLHGDRASYEKALATTPGVTRSDSDLSTSSASTTSSASSH